MTRGKWWQALVLGAAVAFGSILALVVGGSEVSQGVQSEIQAATASLEEQLATVQDQLAQAEQENEHLRRELATIIALLEQVDGLGERIGEIRDMQERDLAGEDDQHEATTPPSESRPPPDPEPSPEPEPEPEPSPQPSPDPSPSPDDPGPLPPLPLPFPP